MCCQKENGAEARIRTAEAEASGCLVLSNSIRGRANETFHSRLAIRRPTWLDYLGIYKKRGVWIINYFNAFKRYSSPSLVFLNQSLNLSAITRILSSFVSGSRFFSIVYNVGLSGRKRILSR